MEKTLDFDCIVIGAGPAGLTASIYLKRANLNVLLIEKGAPGGQMNNSFLVENYPGFESVDGPSLSFSMYDQVEKMGVVFKGLEVLEIIDEKSYKIVRTQKEEFTCKNIIIATGRKSRKLGVTNEEKLVGKGISYCALCDGMFFKDKNVAVVGGGNSAVEEAIQLSKIVNKITLIHRKDKFRADKISVDKLISNPKIEILYNSKITNFVEKEGKLGSILVNDEKEIELDGVFIYIGYEPSVEIFSKLSIEHKDGYLIVNNKLETNIDGIYACGDAILKDVYQIVTATGEGAVAATTIIRNINN